MMKIHFALLAAGRSLRYGKEDKLMEQIGGREILFLLLDKTRKIHASWKGSTVLVVSGEKERRLDIPEICVVNKHPERGISSSIALALEVAERRRGMLLRL